MGYRAYVLLVLFLTMNGVVNFALSQWWPSSYMQLFGLGFSSAGAYLGIALGIEALRYALLALVCLLPVIGFVLHAAIKQLRTPATQSSLLRAT